MRRRTSSRSIGIRTGGLSRVCHLDNDLRAIRRTCRVVDRFIDLCELMLAQYQWRSITFAVPAQVCLIDKHEYHIGGSRRAQVLHDRIDAYSTAVQCARVKHSIESIDCVEKYLIIFAATFADMPPCRHSCSHLSALDYGSGRPLTEIW